MGICVGMQVMFERGVEHGIETDGLDQWPGTVELLQAPVVPNMGWAHVEAPSDTKIFKGVEGERFYFVHSYGAREFALGTTEHTGRFAPPLVTWSTAGTADASDRFVAAVENGPLTATQFHPEKSGDAGLQLLRNWVATLVMRGVTVASLMLVAVAAAGLLTGCTAASNECAAPQVSMSPNPIEEGGEVTVFVTGAYASCNDQGEGPADAAKSATVKLVLLQETAAAAQVEVPIGEDAGGTATLSLASVSPGTYTIWIDDIQESTIDVVAP